MSRERKAQVIKQIDKAARVRGMRFVPRRPGGNHTIYDLDGLSVPICNGSRITKVESIFKQCEDKLGKGWWRDGH